ncbi:MAG: hypothetical protein CME81_05250 [Halomonas sp.]|nr:hypothetical protein [Halomonas sp.]
MIFTKKKKRVTGPKKPAWLIGRGALVAASLFFAAFAVVFWARSIADESLALAIFVAVGFAVSAMVTPSVAPKLAHASGVPACALALVCIVFGDVDSLGVTLGFSGLEKAMTEKAYQADVKVYTAERVRLEAIRDSNVTKRDAVVLATAFADGRPFGPQNKAEARATYEAERAGFQKTIDDAKADLSTLAEPVRPKVFDMTLIALLSTALQAALAFGMIALEAARNRVHAAAVAEYEAKKAAEKAEREKRARAKAKAKVKAEPKIAEPDPADLAAFARQFGGPKLAYSSEGE